MGKTFRENNLVYFISDEGERILMAVLQVKKDSLDLYNSEFKRLNVPFDRVEFVPTSTELLGLFGYKQHRTLKNYYVIEGATAIEVSNGFVIDHDDGIHYSVPYIHMLQNSVEDLLKRRLRIHGDF